MIQIIPCDKKFDSSYKPNTNPLLPMYYIMYTFVTQVSLTGDKPLCTQFVTPNSVAPANHSFSSSPTPPKFAAIRLFPFLSLLFLGLTLPEPLLATTARLACSIFCF